MNLEEFNQRVSRIVDEQLAKSDPRDLYPNGVGHVLSGIGTLLVELAPSYDNNSLDSSCADYRKKLSFLYSLLRELGDNFFPMAHTEKRLRDLRIVRVDDLKQMLHLSQQLMVMSEASRDYIKNVEEIVRVSDIDLTQELIDLKLILENEVALIDHHLSALEDIYEQIRSVLDR
jgi:hypothetical protein